MPDLGLSLALPCPNSCKIKTTGKGHKISTSGALFLHFPWLIRGTAGDNSISKRVGTVLLRGTAAAALGMCFYFHIRTLIHKDT